MDAPLAHLFFPDSPRFIDLRVWRARARRRLLANSLIGACLAGDRAAAKALHRGFWPFVEEFEGAIDRHALPREPLRQRFGHEAPERIRHTIRSIAAVLEQMSDEEGSHAAHWAKDAAQLGIDVHSDRIAQRTPIGHMATLIDASNEPELPEFFGVLAGTEIVAEEMSALLVDSPHFTSLFPRGRWVWGEVHVAPHEGVSHLDIDIDLARAYAPHDDAGRRILESVIARTIDLFDLASGEVEAELPAS